MTAPRSERGVIAVLVGVLVVVLMGASAIAIDLGNAEARQRATQAQADLAAVAGAGAGGANLPAPAPTTYCPNGDPKASATDQPVKDAVTYLQTNAPRNDTGGLTFTAAQMTDCNRANGEVMYGQLNAGVLTPDLNKITVLTPPALVKVGLGKIIGGRDINASAAATAAIKTPLYATLPFYAFTGCDYGDQTIANPTNGQAADTVLLANPNDSNNATESSLATTPASNPVGIASNDTTSGLVLTGNSFGSVTSVGFFESGTATTGPAPVVIDSTKFSISGNGQTITIPAPLPAAVTSVTDVWYVRVKIGGSWSSVTSGNNGHPLLNALAFNVGTPFLNCGQGSSSGNFGTLQLSNSQQSGQWQQIAQNIATGLDSTLGPYPSPHSDWTCNPNVSPSVQWPVANTNCVGTKTGLDANAATSGFITASGIAGGKGLLGQNLSDSTTGCNGLPATTTVLSKTINNDTLSCFFTSSTTNVGQVDGPSYSLPGPAFSQNIWNSPRFISVPIFGVQPSGGSSDYYQIVGFRPGFITDQPASATKTTPATSTNGFVTSGNDVQSVGVIFLNPLSIPPPPPNKVKGLMAYVGSGIKQVALVK